MKLVLCILVAGVLARAWEQSHTTSLDRNPLIYRHVMRYGLCWYLWAICLSGGLIAWILWTQIDW